MSAYNQTKKTRESKTIRIFHNQILTSPYVLISLAPGEGSIFVFSFRASKYYPLYLFSLAPPPNISEAVNQVTKRGFYLREVNLLEVLKEVKRVHIQF